VRVAFGVLGPVQAWDGAGAKLRLKGPRHRAVLARLLAAQGRLVPVDRLVDDLWDEPPPGAVGAVRTFIAALRRALEPDRAPRRPATLLVTEGRGYALRADPDTVDARRFEAAVAEAATAPPSRALELLDAGLRAWRGPAYADLDRTWARTERSRLDQLRLTAVEQRARALLDLGRPGPVVSDLDAFVAEHPWREEAWRLLALALYRTGRQGDALAAVRRARELLREQLGVDPGPRLRRLETDLLRQVDTGPAADAAERLWAAAAAAYDHTVPADAPSRFDSTVSLLRDLALTGPSGLKAAREQRSAAMAAAERTADPELAARVVGGYDVPAIWTRSDDPEQAARIVAAAERALTGLEPGSREAARARLLATIAVESRGTRGSRPGEAAAEAERIARDLGDPRLLAFALNGRFMQTFDRAGLAPERERIGAELVALAVRHDLPAFEILGHLVRLQARSALAAFAEADGHAEAADRLAERHGRPLVGVFTDWYRAMRLAASGAPLDDASAAYRAAAARLDGTGMAGVERGLLPLALLCLSVQHDRPARFDDSVDWGPYEPWARPLVLLERGRRPQAAEALHRTPEPPPDLLLETLWSLTARAAIALGDREAMARARAALTPAERELIGAGSGMLTAGPVSRLLDELDAALA
jgi:DNA-binding SARP family transcriptional activator